MKRYAKYLIALLPTVFVTTAVLVYFIRPDSYPPKTDTTYSPVVVKPIELPPLDAAKIEELVNQERVKAGLAPLVHNELLKASACAKLEHMVANDYWAHTAPDGTQPWYFIRQTGYSYARAGENLAYGIWHNDQALVNSWMNSPTHKENIVANYAEGGVCVRNKASFQGEKSTSAIVHHFGAPQ